jgi:hypothetical protein
MITRLAANTPQIHQSMTVARASQKPPREVSCTTMVGMANSAATISGIRNRPATPSARKAASVPVEWLPSLGILRSIGMI